jgi:Domain of unknown function (DUF5666)
MSAYLARNGPQQVAGTLTQAVARLGFVVWLGLIASCAGETGSVGVGGTGTGESKVATGNEPVVNPPTNPPLALEEIPVTVTGPITGFGSVIVNGVKFDDTTASVIRDAMSSSNAVLRLGMTVEITGSKTADGLKANASQIKVFSEVKGPVQLNLARANTLSILGATVLVDGNTVIDGALNFAAITSGDIAEAFGLRDPGTGEITATRIEVQAKPASPVLVPISLNGVVQSLNLVNKTFLLSGQTIDYSSAVVTGNLLQNAIAQIKGSVLSSGGTVSASTVSIPSSTVPKDGSNLEFEGIVTDFVSTASFKVNAIAVDASSTSVSAAELAKVKDGVRCSVHGKVVSGVVKLSELECKTVSSLTKYEVKGTITAFTSASNFIARNQQIDASLAIFKGGKIADLKLGKNISVKGPVMDNVLKAEILEFDD